MIDKTVSNDLKNSKSDLVELDVDKLIISVDLQKPSNVVFNYVVEIAVYDKLVSKVDGIKTRLIDKTQYSTDKQNMEKFEDVDK